MRGGVLAILVGWVLGSGVLGVFGSRGGVSWNVLGFVLEGGLGWAGCAFGVARPESTSAYVGEVHAGFSTVVELEFDDVLVLLWSAFGGGVLVAFRFATTCQGDSVSGWLPCGGLVAVVFGLLCASFRCFSAPCSVFP